MADPVNLFEAFTVAERSPFDVDKLADQFRRRNTGWSIPEAYLGVLFAAAVADGAFGAEERFELESLAYKSRALSGLSPSALARANDVVIERFRHPGALREACDTLPESMCLPVFARCVDIVLADGELTHEEAEFLHSLVPLLHVDEDDARKVVEVLLQKNRF